MKKHLLLSATLMATASLYAAQYMHVNLDNGKEYDVKIDKADRVSHIEKDSLKYIKVIRKDSSYSLYPLSNSKVNFDNEIARMDSLVSDWRLASQYVEGCELNLLGEDDEWNDSLLSKSEENRRRMSMYNTCVSKVRYNSYGKITDKLTCQSKANIFADQMLAKLAADSTKNYVFSPTSMQFALAMLANGTDDEGAYNQITNALGCSGIALDSLNDWYKNRQNGLKSVSDSQIGMANATWLTQNKMFGKNFLQDLQTYYDASVNNVDFSAESTYDQMDKWTNDVTHGMIPKIGITEDPNLVWALANGLCFESAWYYEFDSSLTAVGDFTTATGEVKQVDKMYKSLAGNYNETNQYQWTNLWLQDGYQMDVILPKEGVNPVDILSSIDWDTVTYKVRNMASNLKLPKFSIDNKNMLNVVLQKMGLGDMYNATYNKIAQGVGLSEIYQLSHLDINEEGVKGAAVTVADETIGGAESPSVIERDMDVNRPFIVCIRNPEFKEILFVGIINDPTINN